MDSQRHDEDPHPRGRLPKLIVAGRLIGTLNGLPVSINASERGILITLGRLGSLLPLARSAGQMRSTIQLLAAAEVSLAVQLGGVSLSVLPRPHWLIRFLLP